jgi:hypothetical protein
MIRHLLALVLFCTPIASTATPDYEARRTSTSVSYETGETVSIMCEAEDRCHLTLEKGQDRWIVGEGEFRGLLLLPRQLSLVAPERDGKFVVQVEIACDVYSEGLPAYICMAQITVDGSKTVDTLVFKRTLVDTRDAAPLIAE